MEDEIIRAYSDEIVSLHFDGYSAWQAIEFIKSCIGEVNVLEREKAREYFKKVGLSYEKLLPVDIEQLAHMIEIELIGYLHSGGDHAKGMAMKVSTIRKSDIKFKDGKFIAAKIQIDGRYFKRREAVTFSETGFIGFGGELDNKNVQPILTAFCNWCEDCVSIQDAF